MNKTQYRLSFDTLDDRVVPTTLSPLAGAVAPAVQQAAVFPGVRDAVQMRYAFQQFNTGLSRFGSQLSNMQLQALQQSDRIAGQLDRIFTNNLNRMSNQFINGLNRGVVNTVDMTNLQNRFIDLSSRVQNNLNAQWQTMGRQFENQFNGFTNRFSTYGGPFADAGSQFGNTFRQSFTDLGTIAPGRFGTLDAQTGAFTRVGGLFTDASTNFNTLGATETLNRFNTDFDTAFNEFSDAGRLRVDQRNESVINFSTNLGNDFTRGFDSFTTSFTDTYGFEPGLQPGTGSNPIYPGLGDFPGTGTNLAFP